MLSPRHACVSCIAAAAFRIGLVAVPHFKVAAYAPAVKPCWSDNDSFGQANVIQQSSPSPDFPR